MNKKKLSIQKILDIALKTVAVVIILTGVLSFYLNWFVTSPNKEQITALAVLILAILIIILSWANRKQLANWCKENFEP